MIKDTVKVAGMNVLHVNLESYGENAYERIKKDVKEHLETLLQDGTLRADAMLKLQGVSAWPMAFIISNVLPSVFCAVGIFEPQFNKYLVKVSRVPAFRKGELVA